MTTTILDFLPHYPSFEEEDTIYSKKEFNDLKLSRNDELPKNKMYQKHQELLSKILSSYTLYDKILLFHEMGTGKGGVAFATSERILSEKFGINKVFQFAMESIKGSREPEDDDAAKGPFGVKNSENIKCMDPSFTTILLLIVCPPLAIFFKLGFLKGFISAIICGVLCVKLYYFPGLLFAILHVLC